MVFDLLASASEAVASGLPALVLGMVTLEAAIEVSGMTTVLDLVAVALDMAMVVPEVAVFGLVVVLDVASAMMGP